MRFCSSCGGLMLPRGSELICSKCGLSEPGDMSGYRFIEQFEGADDVIIVEGDIRTLPTTRAICRRCGNTRAFYWMRQTSSGDEPMTKWFRCTKCGKTWKER